MDNQRLNNAFSELSTPLIADACLRLGLPVHIAPPGICALPVGIYIAGRSLARKALWERRCLPGGNGDGPSQETYL